MIAGGTSLMGKGGHYMYGKDDFCRLPMLPPDWWYYLNEHGEGRKIDFPMKIKATISWSPKKYVLKGNKNCTRTKVPN